MVWEILCSFLVVSPSFIGLMLWISSRKWFLSSLKLPWATIVYDAHYEFIKKSASNLWHKKALGISGPYLVSVLVLWSDCGMHRLPLLLGLSESRRVTLASQLQPSRVFLTLQMSLLILRQRFLQHALQNLPLCRVIKCCEIEGSMVKWLWSNDLILVMWNRIVT